MKNNSYGLYFVIFFCAILVLLPGCGSGIGKIKLTLYFYKPEIQDCLQEMCSLFCSKNQNISIKTMMVPDESYGYLRSLLVSGNAPDIIQVQSYNQVFEFAQAGYLLDLSSEPVILRTPEKWFSAVTWENRIYALPMDFSGIGIFYNKQLFRQFNIAPPDTYLELKKVCGILKENGVHPFAGMLKANWAAGHFLTLLHATLAGSNSGIREWIKNMDSCNGSWADPVQTDMLFNIMDFYKLNLDPRSPAMIWQEQQAVFARGEAGMMVQGLWIYNPLIMTNPDIECGFIPFPLTDTAGEAKFYADVDSTFALSALSDKRKQDAAKKFLAWLSFDEAVSLWTRKCRLISSFTGANLSSIGLPFRDFLEHITKNGYYEWEFCRYPVSVYKESVKNSAHAYLLGITGRADVIATLDNAWRKERKCYGD